MHYVKETQEILEFCSKLDFGGICKSDSGSNLFMKGGKKQIDVGIVVSIVPDKIIPSVDTCAVSPFHR